MYAYVVDLFPQAAGSPAAAAPPPPRALFEDFFFWLLLFLLIFLFSWIGLLVCARLFLRLTFAWLLF